MWGREVMSGSGRRLAVECLEERIALGSISAVVAGGVLTITGGPEADQFTLDDNAMEAGEVSIVPWTGTLVNGQAAPLTVAGVTGIKMALGDGDDHATLYGITIPKDVQIDAGSGTNSVEVLNRTMIRGSLTVKSTVAGGGVDVSLDTSAVLHDVTISAKSGVQTVALVDSAVEGNVSMKIGKLEGYGGYYINGSTILGSVSLAIGQGYHVLGSQSTDSIPFRIQDSIVGPIKVQARGGDYSFAFIDSATLEWKPNGISITYGAGDAYTYIGGTSVVNGPVTVKTGGASDLWNTIWDTEFTVEGGPRIAGKVSVTNFDSDDTVTITDSDLLMGLSISNGTGDATVLIRGSRIGWSPDRVYASRISSGTMGWGFEDDLADVTLADTYFGPLTVSTGTEDATVSLDTIGVDGKLSVTTGSADDWVYLSNSEIVKGLSLKTGAGADNVHINHSGYGETGLFSIDAGAGNDIVRMDAGADNQGSRYICKVKVAMGAGDDELVMGNGALVGNWGAYDSAVRLDGGAGMDAIDYLTGDNMFAVAPKVTFEVVS